jgi:hypothetical protein
VHGGREDEISSVEHPSSLSAHASERVCVCARARVCWVAKGGAEEGEEPEGLPEKPEGQMAGGKGQGGEAGGGRGL